MYIHHTPRPLADAEAYHKFLSHNRHLIIQIKMSVIVFVGVVVIAICVVYIFFQCRTKVLKPLMKNAKMRRPSSHEERKELFGSTDTLDNLLPSDKNSLPLKIRKDTEFFV